LWVFRGTARGALNELEPGVLVSKLPTRPEAIACADWNGDSLPDLLIGGTADQPIEVYMNSSGPGRLAVEAAKPIEGLPYLFWGPMVRADDYNRDGDKDLLVQSEFFSFWIERSFIEHGYRAGRIASSVDGGPVVQQRSLAENLK
jgi:hypothetical protein